MERRSAPLTLQKLVFRHRGAGGEGPEGSELWAHHTQIFLIPEEERRKVSCVGQVQRAKTRDRWAESQFKGVCVCVCGSC